MPSFDTIRLTAYAHHRNGVCGEGFTVALFEWDDPDFCCRPRRMVATLFWTADDAGYRTDDFNGRCAVLDRDLLAASGIEFGLNSWRGDQFEPILRALIVADDNAETRDGGFFHDPIVAAPGDNLIDVVSDERNADE